MKLENEYKEYMTHSSWQFRNGFYAVFSTKTSLTLNEKGVQNLKTKTWLLCVYNVCMYVCVSANHPYSQPEG